MNRLQRLLAVCLVPLLVACPATTKIALKNDSTTEIEVLSAYSDAVLARIEPSGSETVVYSQDCLRIRTGGGILEFQPTIPPAAYCEVRTFSVLVSATFDRSHDLEIIRRDGPAESFPNLSLARGCAEKPMAGK